MENTLSNSDKKFVTVPMQALNDIISALEALREGGEVPSNQLGEINRTVATDVKINQLLLDIGVPMNIKGYRYIRHAIYLLLDSPDYIEAITKDLYPQIASDMNTTGSRVERAIRHAIECAFDRANPDDLVWQMLGSSVSPTKGKPTNSQFLAVVTEYARTHNF